MEYLDEMFSQFSEAFLGNMEGEGDIAFRNQIDTSILDYSLDSLNEVDRYLKVLHQSPSNFSDVEYQNIVVWGGAYVGEVIRRNSNIPYHWVHYDEYIKSRGPEFKVMIPIMLTTHAFLVDINSNYMTMPMNKIARWIDEGDSNNVHFYATADILRK